MMWDTEGPRRILRKFPTRLCHKFKNKFLANFERKFSVKDCSIL